MRFKSKQGVLGTVGNVAILTTAALWLSACGGWPKQSEAAPQVVSGVTVETIRMSPLPETYEAVGTIESKTTSNVGAQVGGTVREVTVQPGDHVRAGEVLAVLDGRALRAQLTAAQAGAQASAEGLVAVERRIQAAAAQRQFADVTYQRYRTLYAEASVSRQEFDNAGTQYKSAAASEAALEAQKTQMQASTRAAKANEVAAATEYGYSRIVSPASGIVTAKRVDPGTLVMPGTTLFTVEDPQHYRMVASLATGMLLKVRMGERVSVSVGAGRLDGRVAEIVPAADPASRTFQVKVELPPGADCRSGEFATADFPAGVSNGLSVPQTAAVERGQLEGVFVVDGRGIATYRLIKTGRKVGNQLEVLSGLSAGERVAVSGVDRLSDGVKVEAQ